MSLWKKIAQNVAQYVHFRWNYCVTLTVDKEPQQFVVLNLLISFSENCPR
jgi:hypothetical protein